MKTKQLCRFVALMEEALERNEGKGGWDDCEMEWLLDRLRDETDELAEELMHNRVGGHAGYLRVLLAHEDDECALDERMIASLSAMLQKAFTSGFNAGKGWLTQRMLDLISQAGAQQLPPAAGDVTADVVRKNNPGVRIAPPDQEEPGT